MATQIRKSAAPMATTKRRPRVESGDRLDFCRKLPCLICSGESEAAHVRYASYRHGKRETGMGEKSDDRWTVPLCDAHHRLSPDSQHSMGERKFWGLHGIDPLCIAALIHSAFTVADEDGARTVCLSARELILWVR